MTSSDKQAFEFRENANDPDIIVAPYPPVVRAVWANSDQIAVIGYDEFGGPRLLTIGDPALEGIEVGQRTDLPTRVVPATITRFQAKAVLSMRPGSRAGTTLLDDVTTYVEAVGGFALLAFREAGVYERRGVLINSMNEDLGITQAELDEMFIEGAKISA